MKTLQTLGIDYEVVGLDTEGSDVSGPVQPERLIDDEIAHLSGHLFDQLPQQVLPLDSFFAPATAQDGTPSAARSDSIAPTAIDGTFAPAAIDGTFATAAIDGTFAPAPTGAPPLPRRTGWGFPALMVATAAAIVVGAFASRPHAPSATASAVSAPVHVAAQAPMVPQPEVASKAPEAPATAQESAAQAKPAVASPAAAVRPVKAEAGVSKPAEAAAPARLAKAEAGVSKPAETAAPAIVGEAGVSKPTETTATAIEEMPIQNAPPAAAPPGPLDHSLETVLMPLRPQQAAVAIAAAGRAAGSCVSAEETNRTMSVSVTYAPSGRVTRATIDSGALRGTAAGSCIAQHLRGATVSPFAGDPVTIVTSLRIR